MVTRAVSKEDGGSRTAYGELPRGILGIHFAYNSDSGLNRDFHLAKSVAAPYSLIIYPSLFLFLELCPAGITLGPWVYLGGEMQFRVSGHI